MFEYFSDQAIKVILLAQEEARRFKQNYVGSEQVLLGILGEGSSIAAKVLEESGVTLATARREVEQLVGRGSSMSPAEIPFTPRVKRIFEQAMEESRQLDHNHIGPEHLLLGLLQDGEGIAFKVLQKLNLDLDTVRKQMIQASDAVGAVAAGGKQSRFGTKTKKQGQALEEFGTNLTQLAAADALDPVVGREQEIERVVQILGRRTKNNPVLLGEPGVGKTAIAEGLAQRIANEDIPAVLADSQVISLDMGLLVAGTRYRGDFEERMNQVLAEVREATNVILVIDEIHTLVGAGGMDGSLDAANILKPALSRGELQCIGATTLDEYRKHIERDPALERRFQSVLVGEPSVGDTLEILRGLRSRYEQHHKLLISDDALEAAAKLSDRYISDRYLPDKAIDLIDEAGSRVHIRHSQATTQTQEGEQPTVVYEDIAQVVAAWTGVPVSKLTASESGVLLNLETTLHERLVGQEEAVKAVAQAMRRARVGLRDPRRPIASFIFAGPTGVGKTELSKALAAQFFGGEDAMVRLDMSEYMERHTVSKLIGSPPGYMGYGDGGQLTEAVRRRPYTVVLFDEIEKAHPDVFNLLLQILEDGHLRDSQGRKVNFKNTILILTSNIGSKVIEKGGSRLGFELRYGGAAESAYSQISSLVNEEMKQYFRPEFINRLDEVIIFRQLNQMEVSDIATLMLKEVSTRLAEQEIHLELTPAFKAHLLQKGYDPSYGARPLRRAIVRLLEDELAEAILAGAVKSGDTALVDVDEAGAITVQPGGQQQLALAARRA